MPRIEAATVAEHNAMRRAQVVAASADVLREQGVGAFTPAEVAKRAGLARSSMYQYYPSTEALLGAGVAELLRRSADRMAAAVAHAGTPEERVAAYVRAAVEDAAEGHGSLADLTDLTMPEHCRTAVRSLHDELLEPLHRALVDGGVADPRIGAVLVQGLVNSAVTAIRHGAARADMVAATVDFVLRGLAVGAAQPSSSAPR